MVLNRPMSHFGISQSDALPTGNIEFLRIQNFTENLVKEA